MRMSRHDPHVIINLQRSLNEYFSHVPHGDILVEDNVFYCQTDAALRRFQTDYRDPRAAGVVDGVAGPKTGGPGVADRNQLSDADGRAEYLP